MTYCNPYLDSDEYSEEEFTLEPFAGKTLSGLNIRHPLMSKEIYGTSPETTCTYEGCACEKIPQENWDNDYKALRDLEAAITLRDQGGSLRDLGDAEVPYQDPGEGTSQSHLAHCEVWDMPAGATHRPEDDLSGDSLLRPHKSPPVDIFPELVQWRTQQDLPLVTRTVWREGRLTPILEEDPLD